MIMSCIVYTILFCIDIVYLHEINQDGMFIKLSWLDNVSNVKTDQRNYGVAVTDVDHDGEFEFVIAGFSGPNIVLKYNKQTKAFDNIAGNENLKALEDPNGEAIGVCACDIDGDGMEEIYFLNTNTAFSGQSSYDDKLFKWRDGKYVDLYSDDVNKHITAKGFAGRSVACIDRRGTGMYSIIIATYSDGETGKFSLIEMDESREKGAKNGIVVLKNVAAEAGIEMATGGRGIVVGPIVNNYGKSDIFFDNEGGPNFLFQNDKNGNFIDVAKEMGIDDPKQHGRGVTVGDFNRDGLIDIVYGNWNGTHRIYLQSRSSGGITKFHDAAPPEFSAPTLVRTVIAADFDNDGLTEIFINNIFGYGGLQPNKVFRVNIDSNSNTGIRVEKLDIGEAEEDTGSGTGGAIADIDLDGKLELLLSHGESKGQSLKIYKSGTAKINNWLRISPVTKYGAPARGALVKVSVSPSNGMLLPQSQVIDGGSGYLCEMEPVAHFGLGTLSITDIFVSVQWPDGCIKHLVLTTEDINKVHKVTHNEVNCPS